MAKFITRVELHGATASDYQSLHHYMAAKNFSRTVAADGGTTYNLPSAEYYSFGEVSAEQVRQIAQSAAAMTGKAAWILVCEYNALAFFLTPVQAKAV